MRRVGSAKLDQAPVRNVRTWPAMPREKMLWGGGEEIASIVADVNRWSPSMQRPNDLSQSRVVLKQDSTLIAGIEMSVSSCLFGGIVPGVEVPPVEEPA